MTTGRTGAPYEDLDESAQVEVLRRVALTAADAYGLEVHRLEPVLHGYNTTFRVDTSAGRALALRVNTNSKSSPSDVAAQQAWVHALAHDTDLTVPDAVAAPDGRAAVAVPCPEVGRELLVVVNTWLDGPDVGTLEPVQALALGRAMATLHQHAAGFALPPGTTMPLFDEPLFGDDNLLEGTELPDPAGRALLDEAFARTRSAFARVNGRADPIPLHADLHGGNLKWHEGRLALFDFDDSGRGVPLVDLAVATFYLRGSDPEVESALRAGYEQVAPLPAHDAADLEALVASRQLLLANSLLTTSTAAWRAQAGEYLVTTLERLGHWMRSGRFVLDPPRG